MKVALWMAMVPLVLSAHAAVAQDDVHPSFGLSASGGVTILKLPSDQNGVVTGNGGDVSGVADPLIYAPTIGVNGVVSLGKIGGQDAFLGISAFGSYGQSYSSGAQSFSGIGTVYVPGLSLPSSGSITLTTTRGASATAGASVSATTPQGTALTTTQDASSGPADGSDSDALVSAAPGDPAFVVAGDNTTVTGGDGAALAYAGIADTSGSILILTGDLDGLSISKSIRNSVAYAGADVTIGVSGAPDDLTSLQAYAGPSFRYIGQWTTALSGASLTVDIPEAAAPTVHPLWIQDSVSQTTLDSRYMGGVLGGGVSRKIGDRFTLGLGAEGSLYYVSTHLGGQTSVTTTGGLPGPSPTVTVTQDPVDASASGVAYAVRAQTSATFAISPSLDLTAAATADYLSKVARPYAGATVTGTGGNAKWSSGGSNSPISFGDMLAFSGTVSVNGHF